MVGLTYILILPIGSLRVAHNFQFNRVGSNKIVPNSKIRLYMAANMTSHSDSIIYYTCTMYDMSINLYTQDGWVSTVNIKKYGASQSFPNMPSYFRFKGSLTLDLTNFNR